MIPLDAWRRAAEAADLDSLIRSLPADPLKAASELRRTVDRDAAAAILELRHVRQRGRSKIPGWAEGFWSDREALEQATPEDVARAKGERFAQISGAGELFDLGCGAGADALGFSAAGLTVRAVDRSPVRVWFASRNAPLEPSGGIEAMEGDLSGIAPEGRLLHLDPARRRGGERRREMESHDPPPRVWLPLAGRALGACVKLAPGIDPAEWEELSAAVPGGATLAFVSNREGLNQALGLFGCWKGEHPRQAWVLSGDGRCARIEGVPSRPPPLGAPFPSGDLQYLIEPDPAVERAGLLGCFDGEGVCEWRPGLGLLLGAEAPETGPLARIYRVLHAGPFRKDRLPALLREQGAGPVAVKTRGLRMDVSRLAVLWSEPQGKPLAVFLFRDGSRISCAVCEPPGLGRSGAIRKDPPPQSPERAGLV